MPNDQLSLDHNVEIEKLADTMKDAGTPMAPELLCVFLRFRVDELHMTRLLIEKAWYNGFREGSKRHTAPPPLNAPITRN